MSNAWYYQSMQEFDVSCKPQFQTLDNISYGSNLFIKPEPNCTLDSSSANGSCTLDSPVTESCVTDDLNEFKRKLRQLETVMLSDLYDESENGKLLFGNGIVDLPDIEIWKKMLDDAPKRDVKDVLIECAKAVSNNDFSSAQFYISELQQLVSVSGEPIQRLGAYMLEGLIARISFSGSSICKEPVNDDLLSSYSNILYEACPYFKFGYMSANGAIAEAMKDEKRVHIVDFQIGQGSQWVPLIQAFAARRGGPPNIRITAFDDTTSAHGRGKLHNVGQRLYKLAKSFNVPFEFHSVAVSVSEAGIEHFQARPGEALAVNFAFVLHRMADESVSTHNHRDRLLRRVKSMNPKVVTLVEQESNTNTAPFYPRFLEALDYYNAMFESMDVSLPRQHKGRINVEQHCLAKDVVNIIACEGNERVERHELLVKWRLRFMMAGFSPYPLSSLVNGTIKTLMNKYSDRYRLEERDGALYLGWMNRDLVASCAWK